MFLKICGNQIQNLPSFFLCTIYIYSPHYRDKQDVSKRLALGAVNHVYGNKLVISDGPYPINAYHSSVFEITVEYDGKQTLALNKVQSFQVFTCLP